MAKPAQVKQIIKEYFDSHKYSYDLEEKDIWALRASFRTETSKGIIGIAFVVHNLDINITTSYSNPIPVENFGVAAEFLLRVNRYLKRGHFYLDYDTGVVHFKMWNPLKGRITDSDINELVMITVGSLETMMSVLDKVIKEEMTISDGIRFYVTGGADG